MTSKTLSRLFRRPSARLILAAVVALIFAGRGSMGPFVQAQTNPDNPVVVENRLPPGMLQPWDISGAGDESIQGFATDISVNTGDTVSFKINTDAINYSINIYRLGYYGDAGARLVAADLAPLADVPHAQPACTREAVDPETGLIPGGFKPTGLVDCGNWAVSASWESAGAVSGIYVARLTRTDTGGSSHIVFVVRDDTRQADVVVQTSDTTWQAYNQYGGGSLYCGGPVSNGGTAYSCAGRATKVSYNRPIDTRAHDPQSFLFNAEYPMVRWLEANGYDVKYISGVDTERRAADLVGTAKPKVFISSGHDEYWSAGQRASVEAARNAGVSLAFFSGNDMYWKTRWETKVDGTLDYRTLVSYKDTLGAKLRVPGTPEFKLDPMPGVSTGTWRDTRFGPPVADGGRPENSLTGQFWTVNSGTRAITVPASMANLRIWRNTRVAELVSGQTALGTDTLGYEWNEDLDNGARPSGLIHLSSTTVEDVEKILDFGETVGLGTATHTLTLYRHTSGALVFGAGTVQWAWGLDGTHDRGAAAPDVAMQQATVNLLADMGAQPGSRQPGLFPADPSMDTTYAPTSVITSPSDGATVGSDDRFTITGISADSGGGIVAGVEVSVDGGTTWRTAQGTSAWSFDWSPAPGSATLRVRAVDDSGNRETPGAGVVVSVAPSTCPCPRFWSATTVPPVPDASDNSAVELGLRFRSDRDGFVRGVRFYKSANNVGTHVGTLWTSAGAPLSTATFTSETASGWQEVLFDAEVPVTANAIYVVSYHTNVGHYAASGAYFSTLGVDAAPLHAPPSGTDGGNGVFSYGPTAFPANTFNATNYWVDVVFSSVADTTAPLIGDVRATPIDSSVAVITWTTNEGSTSSVDYSTDDTFPAAQTTSVSVPALVTAHSVRLTGLASSTAYFYRVRSTDRGRNEASAPSLDPTPPGAPGGPPPPGPPGFMMPAPMLHDTMTADFKAGTSAGAYVAETTNGEVILAPARGAEFSGSTMPSGWATGILSNGGSAEVANGKLIVNGARVGSCDDVAGVCQELFNLEPGPSGISVEFVATFTGDPFQHSGLGQTLELPGEPFALFSTVYTDPITHNRTQGGILSLRTYNGTGDETGTNLGPGLLNAPHRFRIDWKAESVAYYVDGVLKATHAVVIGRAMRTVAASDYDGAYSGKVVVDWSRTLPYASSGGFVSRVFDAGTPAHWWDIQWTADTPAGTHVDISVRTGSTPTPDATTWSGFLPVAAPGGLGLLSRYIQYQAALTTTDLNQTPALEDVTISGDVFPPAQKIAPVITWQAPAAIISGTPLGATQLNARTNAPSTAGVMVYTPPSGEVLTAGPQTLSVTFTPTDPASYETVTATVPITVQVTPTITWGAPASIIAGTALSATQLNATASVAGSFVYAPGIGTVLLAGPAQPLKVTFTPTDAVNYTTATATATITVLPMITAPDVSITEGNVPNSTKQAWVTIKLAQKSTAWVTVTYTTSDGTAKKDVDYFTVSDTAFFAPGVLTQSVAIPIVQDTVGEWTESFFVDFTGSVNGVLGQSRATMTIVNDDSSSKVTSSIGDFSAGTLGGGAYLSETADGELMLAPQGSEFSGASLPAGWTNTPLATGAASTVANGMLAINGAALVGPAETGSGQTLEFTATFSNSPDQRVGLGTSSALGSPMAMFIVRSSDLQLYVRTINGTRILESPMAGIDWLGIPHRYQIVWTAGTVQYYVDGALMISHTSMAWGAVTMRPVIIDSTGGDGGLAVDWIRMTPYAGSGSFTSAVFDATESVLWQKLTTTSTVPSGTTSTITYRKGNTPTPDETWTTFGPLGGGGALAGSSRYVQFAIQIATTSGGKSPVIQDVTVQFKR